MRFIETLRDGDRVSDIYLCKNKICAMTKNGKEYWSLLLQDKTGTIDAKVWDPNGMGIGEFDILDYIEVTGDVTSFNGALQMSIKRIRKIPEESCNQADYLPATDKDIEEMYKQVCTYIDHVKNTYLHTLLHKLFIEDEAFRDEFKKHSAAKSVHHGFIGGLLQHTLAVTNLCYFYCKMYPILNRDLLLTAALVHDIGKIWEISSFPVNDYTDEGQLLGHIIIGVEKVGKIMDEIDGFPVELGNELKHCILAHHGELEYGSPKKPALIEALALHFADNTDAKIQTMTEILNGPNQNNSEWFGYQRLLESNVRKTHE